MYLGQAIQISYNVQFAVDAKHKMVLDHEVTNSVTDLGQLSPLALRAKNVLGVSGFELLADRGYYFGEQKLFHVNCFDVYELADAVV